ncbi:MAG: hypothetical protein V4510_04370 [bacterium]
MHRFALVVLPVFLLSGCSSTPGTQEAAFVPDATHVERDVTGPFSHDYHYVVGPGGWMNATLSWTHKDQAMNVNIKASGLGYVCSNSGGTGSGKWFSHCTADAGSKVTVTVKSDALATTDRYSLDVRTGA